MIRPFSFVLAMATLHLCSCSADNPASSRAAGGAKNDEKGGAGGSASTAGTPQSVPVGLGGNAGATDRGSAGDAAGGTGADAGNVDTTDSGDPAGDAKNSASGFQNLALHNCYQAGCSGFWTNDPYNAFDGDLTTATGSGKTWDSSKGTLAADFGKVQTITKVVVHYQDNSDPSPGYKIEVSDDGQSWTTVKDVSNPALVDTQTDLNASGRYMRVYCKQFFFDPWWMHSVSEIEMWGVSDGQTH